MDRRQFFKISGAAALTAAAGGGVARFLAKTDSAVAAESEGLAARQWVMVFDLRRCDGCRQCTAGCSKMHFLPKGHEWIKVYELESPSGQRHYLPRPCMQCENAPCVRVCPVRATYTTPDGVVLVNQNKCIGCRMCMAACPYGARYFNFDDPPAVPSSLPEPTPEWPVPQKKGTVGKCIRCVHNIRYGKLPGCVEACTMEAIYIGDFNSDLATNGRETRILSSFIKDNDAFRLKEELNTRPRAYYIAGHAQSLKQNAEY